MFSVKEKKRTVFEIAVVVPKRAVKEEDEKFDAIEVLVKELKGVGFIIERVAGLTDEFIKLAAPLETLGKAAEELHMKKPTCIGMDLHFQLEDVDVFVREPDGSLFSWRERYLCYHHLFYSIINGSPCKMILKLDGKEVLWKVGESLLERLESDGIVKQVFPLHDEVQRKKLLRSWVLNWRNLTNQPIDDMYAYFGLKIAVFFAFLRMYTRWILFPALLGLIVQLVNIESLRLVELPLFYISITLWSAIFFQFWKRKNSALLARWHIDRSGGSDQAYISSFEWAPLGSPLEIFKGLGIDKMEEKEAYQRHEWYGHLMRLRNNAVIILSIICLQLPFELAYAHLYEVLGSEIMKFGLTAVYLILIQYFTSIGGNISVKLVQYENSINTEKQSDSVVYKVFGLYFMQSYIGVFYHAALHRDFKTLRQVLVQRLIIYQVFDKLMGNLLPYLKYSYKKYRAVRNKKKRDRGSIEGKIQFSSKVEKEYLKPAYSASIAGELEDGLFDDILQLALQFGMIMMFACAFPLAFALAAVNNFIEIRTVALKLLTTMKRPVPRCAPTIGAWLNIFQFLMIMSICTNSALLVCLYDQEGKWKIEPGLAAILIMEHVLLLIKFGCSRFVPEEPAWVKANRMKNASQAQDVCSKQLLRTLSGEKVSGLLKTD